jgi:sugar phosphate isomerase/epimerase
LAGQGSLDWAAIGAALKEGGYEGWLCLSAGYPVMNPDQQAAIYDALPKTLETLRAAGLH